jgi:two-component system NtrC family sensor kinase
MWRARWSLQTQILILTGLISASVLLIADRIASLSSVRAVEGAASSQADALGRHLASELERWSVAGLSSQFQDHVRELLELEPNIIRVDVYAAFGVELRPVSSSSTRERSLQAQEIEAFRNNQVETFTVEAEPARQIFSVHPFRFSDGRPGFVTVVSSLEMADDILATHARIRLYSIAATIAMLVAGVVLFFRRTVYRSVRHLVDVMNRFKGGENSLRASEDLVGEFGQLARNFNLMLEQIQKFNDRMQQQIQEATAELASRNRELEQLNLQLYEAQKRLIQAERLALVGQLTSTFAHEIGSPLSAVSTHLQMLMEDPGLDRRARDRLRLATEQIDRVCGIVENLLTAARHARRRTRVDLQQVVSRVAALLGPALEARKIQFEFQGSGGPFLIEGDPDQLQQLFLNLFNNSMDAMRGPGSISVQIKRLCSDGQNYFQIDVRDTGVGIPPDKLEDIFEPFFTTKEFGKGTGLGLVVSREIVRQHRGQISAMSEPGRGACFSIILPEAQPAKISAEGAGQ